MGGAESSLITDYTLKVSMRVKTSDCRLPSIINIVKFWFQQNSEL